MKKRVFAVMAVVLFMSSSSFANVQPQPIGLDCLGLFDDVYDAYAANGYSGNESFQAANWAYEGCVSNGGDPGGDSVIIIQN